MIKLYLNSQDNEITWNKKKYLLAAAKRLGLENYILEYNSASETVPENILNIEPYGILATGTNWTGSWWIDTLLNNPKFNSEHPYIDTIFLAGSSPKIEDREKQFLLFQAADSEMDRPLPIKKDCDFILAGSMGLDIYRERERVINLLRKEGFTYVGAGKDFRLPEYVKQLNRARVQFIRSMDVEGHGEIAQRFFECLAIGPVLTNWVDDLQHTGLVEGVDYLSYKTDEEAIEKMHKLIDNPEYANQVALSGQYKSKMYHQYEHRLITIIEKINEHTLHK